MPDALARKYDPIYTHVLKVGGGAMRSPLDAMPT